jgi:hypothetical protein
MNDKRQMLRHFLASLAYRTQKALCDAPEGFAAFRVAPGVRTPHEILHHMTSVIGYARTFFIGGECWPEMLEHFDDEVLRFHDTLESLSQHLEEGEFLQDMTPERILQGPFSDAMSHAGQLAMLRRFFGSPIPPENFIMAAIEARNVGPHQPDPVSPDKEWHEPGKESPKERKSEAT